MEDLGTIYRIDPDDFNLVPGDFDHQSKIHGIGHVYRVMFHCLKLGIVLDSVNEARLAFFAAYLHDLCRKHDGICTELGRWAAEQKFPLYQSLFLHYELDDVEKEHIRTAILYHSLPEELPTTHASWKETAILKDADALDRIRLGENDLDPRYLRFKETMDRIGIAKELYYKTYDQPLSTFSRFIEVGI
jgi:hypothetical protein